jgi:hypothetical protein
MFALANTFHEKNCNLKKSGTACLKMDFSDFMFVMLSRAMCKVEGNLIEDKYDCFQESV